MKGTIIIDKPVQFVFASLERQFSKTFKTSPSKLPQAKVTIRKNMGKSFLDYEQQVIRFEENKIIEFTSTSPYDFAITTYACIAQGQQTKLVLKEKTKGNHNMWRSVVLSVYSLPIINRKTKKMLVARLQGLKMFIEEEK